MATLKSNSATTRPRKGNWLKLSAPVLLCLGLACPSAASAATVESTLVQGKAAFGYLIFRHSVKLSNLVVITAENTTVTAVASCRGCPPPPHVIVPRTGVVDLAQSLHHPLLRPGDTIDVELTNPQGRRKIISLVGRRRGLDHSHRCFDAGSQTARSCAVTCVVGNAAPPGDPCEGAGERARISHGSADDFVKWKGRRSWFKRLTLTHLPSDSAVVVHCTSAERVRRGGRGCPFFVSALSPSRGKVDVARALKRAKLLPGSTITLWLVQGNRRGDVVRYTMRLKRVPRVEHLCIDPEALKPQSCATI